MHSFGFLKSHSDQFAWVEAGNATMASGEHVQSLDGAHCLGFVDELVHVAEQVEREAESEKRTRGRALV